MSNSKGGKQQLNLFKIKCRSRDTPRNKDDLKEDRLLAKLNSILKESKKGEEIKADDLIYSVTPFSFEHGLCNICFISEDARDAAIDSFQNAASSIVPGMSFNFAYKGDGGISLDDRDDLKCRFYENKYPVKEETCIVHVVSVDGVGAKVELVEYNNLQGLIQFSDLSKGRMRSINAHIQEDTFDIAKVKDPTLVYTLLNSKATDITSEFNRNSDSTQQPLIIDPKWGWAPSDITRNTKFSIDLDKKNVEISDREQCLDRFHKSNQFHLVFKVVADLNKEKLDEIAAKINATRPNNEQINTLECLYETIGWPLYKQCKEEGKHPYDSLKIIAFSAKAKSNSFAKSLKDADNDDDEEEGYFNQDEDKGDNDEETQVSASAAGGGSAKPEDSLQKNTASLSYEEEDKPEYSPLEINVFKSLLEKEETKPIINSLLEYVKNKLAPKALTIRAEIELMCYSYEGVDAIKKAIENGEKVGTADVHVSITYKAAPLFRITVITLNKNEGEDACMKSFEEVKKTIKSYNGTCELKSEPEVVTNDQEERKIHDSLEKGTKYRK